MGKGFAPTFRLVDINRATMRRTPLTERRVPG